MFMVVVVLSLILIFTLAYLCRLKKDISQLTKSLEKIKKMNTNKRLTTTTFDKDICHLCLLMNEVLENHQKLVRDTERTTGEFRKGITNISHDLRTPLTSAVGYIQMIKSQNLTEKQKSQYLQIVEERLKSLIMLMKELFDYTQISEGKVELTIERINICQLLQTHVVSFYDDFDQKDFQVEIKMPEEPFYVFCDQHLFERITQNLIQNVIIHGVDYFELVLDPVKKRIIFRNRVTQPNLVDVSRLFERFYTVDASRSNKKTGLGLAITKELVLHMNGRIEAIMEGDMLNIWIELPSLSSTF